MSIYDEYSNYVKSILETQDLSNFKSQPSYTYMLEHVSKDQGEKYLQLIKLMTEITVEEIREFCKMNDSLGNPGRETIDTFTVSPTSLRYIFHAHLILTHIRNLKLSVLDIVEIGGGYGGLCLALHFFCNKYMIPINSYTIIDLENAIQLQNLYISKVNPSLQINFVNSSTFGSNIQKEKMFLISNYCFSEIEYNLQIQYIARLFPKIVHGFMAWNHIPTYYFGFSLREEDEYPKTGQFNKYIYF